MSIESFEIIDLYTFSNIKALEREVQLKLFENHDDSFTHLKIIGPQDNTTTANPTQQHDLLNYVLSHYMPHKTLQFFHVFIAQDSCRLLQQSLPKIHTIEFLWFGRSQFENDAFTDLFTTSNTNLLKTIKTIGFAQCQLHDFHAMSLGQAFEDTITTEPSTAIATATTVTHSLDLADNFIGAHGICSLFHGIASSNNRSLVNLNLSNNKTIGDQGVHIISSYLHHTRIQKLGLKRTGMTDQGLLSLAMALGQPCVTYNNDKEAKYTSNTGNDVDKHGNRTNKIELKELWVTGNDISNQGMQYICHALKNYNKTLTDIDYYSNKVTDRQRFDHNLIRELKYYLNLNRTTLRHELQDPRLFNLMEILQEYGHDLSIIYFVIRACPHLCLITQR